MHRVGAHALRSSFWSRSRCIRRPVETRWQGFHRARPLRKDDDREQNPSQHADPVSTSNSSSAPQPHSQTQLHSGIDASTNLTEASAAPVEVSSSNLRQFAEQLSFSDRQFLRRLFDIDDDGFAELVSDTENFMNEKYGGKSPSDTAAALDELRAAALAKHDALSANYVENADLVPDYPTLRSDEEGLMAAGETVPEDRYPDEPYEADDIAVPAHGQLDQQRDLRHYMRVIAWEMPQLSKFAMPYKLPSDRPLRFRYTTYMGESHPAENKVVVEFCTADLPLTPPQRLKLIKLVGPRYDPQKDLVKMSCESFTSQAQNKRYLGDLVEKLMSVAKGEGDSAEAKDSFRDVPVDFRHVKWKSKLEFPDEWKMTPEKKQALDAKRSQIEAADQQRIEQGQAADGLKTIKESYAIASPVMERNERAGRTLQGRMDRMHGKAKPRDLRLS